MTQRRLAVAVTVGVLALAGCGDDGGGGGAGGSEEQGTTDGAKKAPTLDAAKGGKGTVTMCAGKDTSGALTEAIKRFNKEHEADGIKVVKRELAADATEVRNQFIQRAQAKSDECDVLQSDIIWTAEFAQQGWIMDLSDYAGPRKDEFIESTLSSYDYDGKVWGLPQVTGAGLLYRRTDQVKDPPQSWQQLYEEGAANDGLAYQGAPYEGLTCNFVELSSAAGGTILSEDGKKAEFDSPENLKALQLMVDGMKSGGAVKASRTFMEEPARMAFEAGKATFMRNWSYAYALDLKAKQLKGKLAVTPLPSFEGGGKGGVLGGNGPVLSAYSKNPKGALLFIDHITSPETLELNMSKFSLPSVLNATYDAPSVKKAVPYAAQLKAAIESAKARPVSPVYPQISQAIYNNVNAALSGQKSPEDALNQGQAEIKKALTAF